MRLPHTLWPVGLEHFQSENLPKVSMGDTEVTLQVICLSSMGMFLVPNFLVLSAPQLLALNICCNFYNSLPWESSYTSIRPCEQHQITSAVHSLSILSINTPLILRNIILWLLYVSYIYVWPYSQKHSSIDSKTVPPPTTKKSSDQSPPSHSSRLQIHTKPANKVNNWVKYPGAHVQSISRLFNTNSFKST